MDIKDLRLFLHIVKRGSYRAAAEASGVAQPFITRRIHQLERTLGRTLFHRGPGGTTLTRDGEALIVDARRMVDLADHLVLPHSDGHRANLRLGAAATAAGSILATFLTTWIPANPNVELTMLEDGALKLKERLMRHECDLALVAPPIPDSMDHRRVTEVTVQALIPRDHRLAETSAPLTMAELQGERVMVSGASFISTTLIHAAAKLSAVELNVVYESSVGQTLAALAEGGLGIALIGDSVDLRGFDLPRRPVVDHGGRFITFELHVAWMRDRPLPKVANKFARDLAAMAYAPIATI
jgi:DNA-binding transcriptional LysR family regulator